MNQSDVFTTVVGYSPPIIILALVIYIWKRQSDEISEIKLKLESFTKLCSDVRSLDQSFCILSKTIDEMKCDVKDAIVLIHKTQRDLYEKILEKISR